ncbi:nucleotide-binding alpha-beta plait domain-containing protein [Tanacetum coccineum]
MVVVESGMWPELVVIESRFEKEDKDVENLTACINSVCLTEQRKNVNVRGRNETTSILLNDLSRLRPQLCKRKATVTEESGQEVMVAVKGPKYQEIVNIRLGDGSTRRGHVLEVDGERAVVQSKAGGFSYDRSVAATDINRRSTIADMEQRNVVMNTDSSIYYLGCIRSIGDVLPFGDANKGQSYRRKVDIKIIDGNIVEFTMWDNLAKQFNKDEIEKTPPPVIIVVTSCRVTKYKDVQLAATLATHYYINPRTHAAFKEKYSLNPPLQITKYRYEDPEKEKNRNRQTLKTTPAIEATPRPTPGIKKEVTKIDAELQREKTRTQRDPSSNGLPMIQRNTMETESATIQATTIHATNEFEVDGRIVWVEVEGVPFKLWTDNTFTRIAEKWGKLLDVDDQDETCFHSKRLCVYLKAGNSIREDFKITHRGKMYWIRANETQGWVPEFTDEYESEDDNSMDEEGEVKKNGIKDEHSDGEIVPESLFEDGELENNHVDGIFSKKEKEVSEDPFNLYSLLKRQNKLDDKDTNSEDSLKHPPGFTPLTHNCENDTSEKKVDQNDEFSEAGDVDKLKGSANGSISAGHFKVSEIPRTGGSMVGLLEDVIKVGQVMGFKMEGVIANLEELIGTQGGKEGYR